MVLRINIRFDSGEEGVCKLEDISQETLFRCGAQKDNRE